MEIRRAIGIILIFLFSLHEIKSDPLWEINFYSDYDEDDKPSNEFNLTRGNYKTIKFKLKNLQNNIDNIQHFNATLTLSHKEIRMIPNKKNINTEKYLSNYYIELGIPCNTDSGSINDINFEIEESDMKSLFRLTTCKANKQLNKKVISLDILNMNNITNNLFGNFLLKQDFKNFEKITVSFSKDSKCNHYEYFLKINNIAIESYTGNLNYFYSEIKGNKNVNPKYISDDAYECEIDIKLEENEDNNQCFEFDEKKVKLYYYNKDIEINKATFYHNAIVSSFIESNDNNNNTNAYDLSLYFFKDNYYFLSFCVIQDKNYDFISKEEIINQRLDYKNNYANFSYAFFMKEFEFKPQEHKLEFKNLDKNIDYKIKCFFNLSNDEDEYEVTYGEGMQIPMKINFNSSKSILGKDCYNEDYMKNKDLDTRYCDIINHRLIFKMFYDMDLKYSLNDFNITDFLGYLNKSNEEKIEYLINIINNNISITFLETDELSAISDYLFLIYCQENKTCQEQKINIFKQILFKYNELNIENTDTNTQSKILNDILLFMNIIENSDALDYDNFDIMVNQILNKRSEFFIGSIRKYSHILGNIFLLIYDKLISTVRKFKSIYTDKLEVDKKINIYKNDQLINFYNLFILFISNGMVNSEHRLRSFLRNIQVNFVETPVNENITDIINSGIISITGFESQDSKNLYEDIYSAGAILYKYFPLFPLENKKSKALTFFLYTDTRENFYKNEISYSETFKIIFKDKNIDNYCYLWNNDYSDKNKEIVNNFISTEYISKDNDKYDINCVSRVMISPMTIILGQNDINGSILREGISFLFVLVMILITLCLVLISLPLILSKYYSKNIDIGDKIFKELN